MAIVSKAQYRGQKRTDGLSGSLSFEQDRNRLIGRDSDNVPRLILLADGEDFLLKISKLGIDVTDASDADLIFNSGQNIFKIADILTGSLALDFSSFTQGGSAGTFSLLSNNNLILPHDVGVPPAILAFRYDSINNVYRPISNGGLITGSTNPQVIFNAVGDTMVGHAMYTWSISITDTTIKISGNMNGGGCRF